MRLVFVVTALLAVPVLAQAQSEASVGTTSCGESDKHVLLMPEGEWDVAVARDVRSDLSAALAGRDLELCSNQTPNAGTVSVVTLGWSAADTVRIQVDDELTDKTVTRHVRVTDRQDGSTGLIIAVAVDELLRATWAELSLRAQEDSGADEDQSVPAAKASDPNGEPVEEPNQQQALPRHRLGAGAVSEWFIEGSSFWGGDVFYGSRLGSQLEWTVAVGPRVSRNSAASPEGRVVAEALSLGASLHAPLLRPADAFIGPVVSVAVLRAWLRGIPDDVAEEGESLAGWGLVARGGLAARVQSGRVFVRFSSQLGAPLVRLQATDSRGIVGGLTGLEWSSNLGVGWWWGQ